MAERKDRLGAMTGGSPSAAGRPDGAGGTGTVKGPLAAMRVLLYAPPPTPAAAWLTLLQNEGIDALVATSPEAASVLLDSAPPALIVAVVPALGETLRDLFRRKAPVAELRVVAGLGPLLLDQVLPPRQALDFAVRAVASVAGILASSRGVPRERTARVVEWSEKAATALGLPASDVSAARFAAALYEVPHALVPEGGGNQATQQMLGDHWTLLAGLAEGFGCPFPIGAPPPASDAASRAPTPSEVVDAAVAYAVLLEGRPTQAGLELRKQAAAGLHPAAVEAVLAAAGGERDRVARGKVLLVDGDAAARSLLALRLANEGYEVDTVSDGRAALDSVLASPPALVLSETVLAGLDGYALLDAMKRAGRGSVPFVFLSSRSDALSVNKGLLLGAADYLPKPANHEVLLTKLQKLLGQALLPAEVSARISLSDVSRVETASLPAPSYAELAPGVTLLGRFRILAALGEGGMGKVFKARDERLDEDVVIKVMKDSLAVDSRVLEHFKREIRLARKIAHPAVVRTFDFWEAGALKFVTMELMEGTDLAAELKRRGAFPLPVVLRLAAQLLEALAAAHELGVIHRDIKPHNVFLLAGGHLKVLDFGIAQGLDPASPDARTITTSPIGTPEYMSPEQLMGEKLDARTDLYSAGVVVFELLTGKLPFAGATRMTVATQRLRDDAPRPSQMNARLPAEVDGIVGRLLARSRDDRYPSARAALKDLRALRLPGERAE